MCRLLMIAMLALPIAVIFPVAAEKADMHGPTGAETRNVTPSAKERVDINRASLAELLTIPGMTPSWAGRIARFRPYHAKSDLLQRGVLPSDVYDRIKNYVIAHRVKRQ